ncbi:MAG TPA: FixH family protein [Acetobacteraceae bacterium]|nr:FixH family protein [Acetobacteraceae bacterium]
MSPNRSSSFSFIPWLFVAGFAIVIAVNGIMMWLAIGSFSGLYSDHARERGVHYNQIVAEQKSRDALGWTVVPSWQAEGGVLGLKVSDAAGKPLAGAVATIELVRPAERRAPLDVALNDLGDGRFAGHVVLPERGNWDADIVIEAGGRRFALTKRLFLQ